MLSLITGLLGLADPISKITGQIAQVRLERAKAETDQEKIHADERIRTLVTRRDVLVAESKSPFNGILRAFLAIPVGVLLWKVFVYDKALGQWTHGRTEALSPELWQVVMVVVGFYFLSEMVRGRR